MVDLRILFGLLFVTSLADSSFLDTCKTDQNEYNLNVVLLEDDLSDWNINHVKTAVNASIEKLNAKNGIVHVIITNKHIMLSSLEPNY